MKLEKLVGEYFKKKGLPFQPALTFADVVIRDNFSEVDSRSDINNLKARLTKDAWISKILLNIPIVSSNMADVTGTKMAIVMANLGGLGFLPQFSSLEERVKMIQEVKQVKVFGENAAVDIFGRLRVGVAIRLNGDYLKEVSEFLRAGADVILLDTARGNSKRVREAVKNIKKKFYYVKLVVGNIDTPEAALMLIQAGADCLKVGIGPGSACITREATGVGIPQITAVASCAAVARKFGVPIISDGGIRSGADLSKALVAGANLVMLGGLLVGTDESPGKIVDKKGKKFKVFRGSASEAFQLDRIKEGSLDKSRPAEGVERRVPYTGPISSVMQELLGVFQSSMSYVGARNLEEFWEKGKFVWQSRSGYEEGKPQS